jgi:hypothetical protein
MYRIDSMDYQVNDYSPDQSQKQFVKVVANIVSPLYSNPK